MKKVFKSTIAAVMACTVIAGGAACKPKVDENAGKTAIRLSYYIGEFGDEWLKAEAKDWSASNEKYYIDVKTNLNLGGTIVADVKSGAAYDVYISEDCAFQQLFSGDYLEDLSDVLSVKPEGKKSIGEKINDADHWAEAASENGKTYLLPYNISPCGLIFDFDRFKENGWLVTDADGSVSAGKDGIKGTYDDGQPATMAEFKTMCEKIKVSGVDDVFLYMGALHPEYANNVAYSYLAGELGESGYRTFYKHDSQGAEIELLDGTKTAVSIDDGYKTWQMKGIDAMAEFLQDYLCNSRYVSDATLNDRSLSVDASHTKFIQVADNTPAFIIEGNWFEYGSKSLIEANVRYGGKAYGESDYRYMLLPSAEGEKSQAFSQTGGSILVTKQNDEEKSAAIKDFLAYLLTDENMAKVTADTGMIWNYSYEVSPETRETMTKFSKSAYDMAYDTKNVTIHSAYIDTASTPIYAYSSLGASGLMMCSDLQYNLVTGFRDKGNAASFTAGIVEYNTAARWAGYLSQAKSYGFYTE